MLVKRGEIYARQINYVGLRPDFPTASFSLPPSDCCRLTAGTRDRTETFLKTRRFAPEKHTVTTMDTALVATKRVRAVPALRFSVPLGCHSLSPNFFYTDLPHRGSSVTRYVLVSLHPSGKYDPPRGWESYLRNWESSSVPLPRCPAAPLERYCCSPLLSLS